MSHNLKWPDIVELLLACKDADERRQCFHNIVIRVTTKDDMDYREARKNLLNSLCYIAGYYDSDVCQWLVAFSKELSGKDKR